MLYDKRIYVCASWEMLSVSLRSVLESFAAVWCSAGDTKHKLLDRVVSCVRSLTGGVFGCDIAYRRSSCDSIMYAV